VASAIILFAHGARDPEWARPFHGILARLQQILPDTPVMVAYLECVQPTLADAVTQLAAEGTTSITLIPMFLARGGHLKEDLPKRLDLIRQQHPELNFNISPAIGEVDAILQNLADWVYQEHQRNKKPA